MTADVLRTHTRKELETMARRDRIAGWHDMNKEELVHAILKNFHSRRPVRDTDRPTSRPTHSRQLPRNGHSTAPAAPSSASRRTRAETMGSEKAAGSGKTDTSRRRRSGDESPPEIIPERQATIRDEVSVEGYDSRWIHVSWSISQPTRERAKASLGTQWRSAVAVLRIFDVSGDEDRGTSRLRSGDVTVDLDEGHWFVRNGQPGRRSVVEIGYRLPSGQFHTLLHSSPVTLTQERGTTRGDRHGLSGSVQGVNGVNGVGGEKGPRRNTADQLIPKSVSAARHALDSRASDAPPEPASSQWRLDVQAELVLSGQTHPRAEVKALHQKVTLNSDGRFSLRVPLENGRLVLPAEVVSPDGSEQRMTIVAVEYNVRELEAQVFDETAD